MRAPLNFVQTKRRRTAYLQWLRQFFSLFSVLDVTIYAKIVNNSHLCKLFFTELSPSSLAKGHIYTKKLVPVVGGNKLHIDFIHYYCSKIFFVSEAIINSSSVGIRQTFTFESGFDKTTSLPRTPLLSSLSSDTPMNSSPWQASSRVLA